MLEGTPKGDELLAKVRAKNILPHVSMVNIAETAYILCRKVGHEAARAKIRPR